MYNTDRIINRLPGHFQAYNKDSILNKLISAIGKNLEAAEEDINSIMTEIHSMYSTKMPT